MERGAYFLAPFIPLAAWLYLLWSTTGNLLGDSAFAHYNVMYSLHPVRVAAFIVRRFYFLFLADFRWIGSIALVLGWRHIRT
jgi:hypothetical protein